jgi:hypothetical protein
VSALFKQCMQCLPANTTFHNNIESVVCPFPGDHACVFYLGYFYDSISNIELVCFCGRNRVLQN